MAGHPLQEPVETGGRLIKIHWAIKLIVANSSRLRSMNSGLNLSPVMYSVAKQAHAFSVSSPYRLDNKRTKSVFVRQSRDHTCREIADEILSQEDKVLEAPSRRRVGGGEYR